MKARRLTTSISDHLNGLAPLVSLNPKNADRSTFFGKGQSGGARYAGSAARDNGQLTGHSEFVTCAHDVAPKTGSDAFTTVDDQRVPSHEGGHVGRKEQDRIGDFICAAPAPHRDDFLNIVFQLITTAHLLLEPSIEWRVDETRT